jgi:hypothetical protein
MTNLDKKVLLIMRLNYKLKALQAFPGVSFKRELLKKVLINLNYLNY